MLNISQIKKIDAVRYKGKEKNSPYNKIVVYKDGDRKNVKTIQEWVFELKYNSKKEKQFIPSQIFKCASGYFKSVYSHKWNFAYMEDIEEFNIFQSISAMRIFLQIKHNNKELVAYNLMGYPVAGFESVWHALKWLKDQDINDACYKNIIDCARSYNKKVKTHKRFVWRFLEDIKLER